MTAPALLRIDGQTLELHPERAVIWRERRTVIVADTHFGKSAVFGRNGIAVPAGADETDLARLTQLIRRSGALRLVILGDFLHAPLEPDSPEAKRLSHWITSLRPASVQVIAGNHDRGALRRWQPPVEWCEAHFDDEPFLFTHDGSGGGVQGIERFTLSGHVHPVVRLGGLRKRGLRVPVFWQHAAGLVLPSFGLFTGGYAIKAGARDRLFAVAEQAVVPL